MPQIAFFQSTFFLILEKVISLDFFEKLNIRARFGCIILPDNREITQSFGFHIRCKQIKKSIPD